MDYFRSTFRTICEYLSTGTDLVTLGTYGSWPYQISVLVNHMERLQEPTMYIVNQDSWDLAALRVHPVAPEHQKDWQRFLDILDKEDPAILRQVGQFLFYSIGRFPFAQINCEKYDRQETRWNIPIYVVDKKMSARD